MSNIQGFVEAYKESLIHSDTSISITDTIEINYPDFTTFDKSIYLVRSNKEFEADVEVGNNQFKSVTFIPFNFDIKFQNTQQISKLNLIIDNFDIDDKNLSIVSIIEGSLGKAKKIIIKYRPYRSGIPIPQISPTPTFYIESIEVTDTTITAGCGAWNLLNKSFPTKIYTPDEYPNLQN